MRTDEVARVLQHDGSPFHGRYATGKYMASVFGSHYPGAGSLIGPAMTFGFDAARHVTAAAGINN